jgi:hypothetical protein
MRNLLIAAFAPLAAFAVNPTTTAYACACCAEQGTWRVSIVTSEKVMAAVLATNQRRGVAAMGGPGTRHEPEEARKVRLISAVGGQIVLASAKGRIVLKSSNYAVLRVLDITFAAGRGGAGGAKLLKTYSALGQATISGDLAKLFGAKSARVSLVVLGVGNNCASSKDMKRWQIRLRKGSRTIGHATFPASR